jgi:hypothetical protein
MYQLFEYHGQDILMNSLIFGGQMTVETVPASLASESMPEKIIENEHYAGPGDTWTPTLKISGWSRPPVTIPLKISGGIWTTPTPDPPSGSVHEHYCLFEMNLKLCYQR